MIEKAQHNIIKMCIDRKEFGPLEDGYQHYWPSGKGALAAWHLRAIADHLDRMNSAWDWYVCNDPLIAGPE
jgi:hypothetical protein